MELDVGQSPVLASVQQNLRNLRIESWDLQQTDSTDIQTQPTKIGCYDGGQWRRFAGFASSSCSGVFAAGTRVKSD